MMRIRNNRVSQPLISVKGTTNPSSLLPPSPSSSSSGCEQDEEFFIYCSAKQDQAQQQQQFQEDEDQKLRNNAVQKRPSILARIRNSCVSQPLLARMGDHNKIKIINKKNNGSDSTAPESSTVVTSLGIVPTSKSFIDNRANSAAITTQHFSQSGPRQLHHDISNDDGINPQPQKDISVSFSKVHILECPIEYDDSNLMSQYPIRLGAPFKQITMSVNKFESKHKKQYHREQQGLFDDDGEEKTNEKEYDTNDKEVGANHKENNNKKPACELSSLERKELLMALCDYSEDDIEGMERIRKIQWAKQRLHCRRGQTQ